MFGYITPLKPELKIKDYEEYKAHYCGLCFGIKKNLGQTPRIFLSYDILFLCLFLDALSIENKTTFSKKRCIIHPFKKRIVANSDKLFQYGAVLNTSLAYYKCLDDLNDDRNKIKAFLKSRYANISYKKSKNFSNNIDSKIEKMFISQIELEKDNACLDKLSEPFSEMLYQCVLNFGNYDNNTTRILKVFTYNLGKWVYILDAWDDIKKDLKNQSFNPFIKKSDKIDLYESIIINEKERVLFNLDYALSEIIKSFELLKLYKHKAILENIIYSGLFYRQKMVFNKEEIKNEKLL